MNKQQVEFFCKIILSILHFCRFVLKTAVNSHISYDIGINKIIYCTFCDVSFFTLCKKLFSQNVHFSLEFLVIDYNFSEKALKRPYNLSVQAVVFRHKPTECKCDCGI